MVILGQLADGVAPETVKVGDPVELVLGTRGVDSGSYFFPPSMATSANPAHPFEEREPVELSRRGRVWSLATNHYQPPEPYMSPEPFEPYTVKKRWSSWASSPTVLPPRQ